MIRLQTEAQMNNATETRPWLAVGIAALFGLIVSVYVAYSTLDGIRETKHADVRGRMSDLVSRIEAEMQFRLLSLEAMGAHFSASGVDTHASFSSFASISCTRKRT